ncbi:hypothetical protein QCA50_010658 [Cerrena zonata]|uniref:Uncharacterized protein n=1 Tax=Cerrena zonata TaxID=2478898 RepID=A0AAW0G507_9APHY
MATLPERPPSQRWRPVCISTSSFIFSQNQMVAGRDHVRDQIIHNHIQRVFRDNPDTSKHLMLGLTYETAINLVDNLELPHNDGTEPPVSSLPGGINEDDLLSLGNMTIEIHLLKNCFQTR